MIKNTYKVIGVMSGTSLDGIDLVYATYKKGEYWNFTIHYAETIGYSKAWKTILSQLTNTSEQALKAIDCSYSEHLAKEILNFIKKHNISSIDFVASHGHTALHQPERGFTYQIGNQQVLADILKIKVICDFRLQDVELGGQGAPLVPIGDRLLFRAFDYCLNLGGFANISYDDEAQRIAYDICPVNIVLNHYVARLNLEFDNKGKLAQRGTIDYHLLKRLNALPFYTEKPPKSLGLEWVETHVFPLINSYQLNINDILRTYVEHIAVQISNVITQEKNKVLVTGGGAYNSFLVQRLQLLSKSEIVIPQSEILEYKEALIFGLLGVLKDRDEINCLKSVTGAERNHSSGKILIPKK